MYSLFPTRWRLIMIVVISSAWALLGAGGIAAAFDPPNDMLEEWGPIPPAIGGTVLAMACVLAILGLIRERYRWEWVASWIAGAALSSYVVTLWWLTFAGVPDYSAKAFFMTALLVCVLSRSAACAAHAARLRHEYLLTSARLDAVQEAVDGSD